MDHQRRARWMRRKEPLGSLKRDPGYVNTSQKGTRPFKYLMSDLGRRLSYERLGCVLSCTREARLEVKNELGVEGDPRVQGSFLRARFWTSKAKRVRGSALL